MITALSNSTIDRYVYISTASVYRDTADLPVGEEGEKLAGPQPELGPFADYGYNKWLAELSLRDICEKRTIPYTSIRPAIIYGKYNYAPRESYFFDLILDGKPLVMPEGSLALFSFVSVWDVAASILACLERKEAGNRAFNIAGDELVSYQRLWEVFESVTGRTLRREGTTIDRIIREHIPLPFPPDQHLLYGNRLSREVLGMRYTPFVEGMRETWRYYLIGKGIEG
jgi:nucleoside-diphosphate-sugar epimerase